MSDENKTITSSTPASSAPTDTTVPQKLARAFSFPLILLPSAGMLITSLLVFLTVSFQPEPQKYENFTCGDKPTPDCLGFSLVTTGPFYPFYILAYGIMFTGMFALAIAPAVLAIAMWIRKIDQTKTDKPRLTIVRLFKILYSDKPGTDV